MDFLKNSTLIKYANIRNEFFFNVLSILVELKS